MTFLDPSTGWFEITVQKFQLFIVCTYSTTHHTVSLSFVLLDPQKGVHNPPYYSFTLYHLLKILSIQYHLVRLVCIFLVQYMTVHTSTVSIRTYVHTSTYRAC